MRNICLIASVLLLFGHNSSAVAQELPLLASDSFEGGMSLWKTSDPEGVNPTWEIIAADDAPDGHHVLRSKGGSTYEPPHRSPWNIAMLKDSVTSDFELTVCMQNTNYEAGDHRDLCVFWGYQDPAHFYYVHLGAKPDPHSCQIFIVDNADRKMITDKKSEGTPWGKGWHKVKVTRNVESGGIKVYFDDMQDPVMTAHDKQFTWGRVGIGTFDDNGNFDDFQLRGKKIEPVPVEARLFGD